MKLFPISLIVVCSAFAGEYAILADGSRVYADRHDNDAAMIRLFTPKGLKQIPADMIERFEQGEPMLLPKPPALDSRSVAAAQNPLPPVLVVPQVDPHMLILAAAKKHGVRAALVKSIIAAESGFRPDAISNRGAIGLMQLMPSTAEAYGADPHNPEQNVDAGTRYLRELIDKYKARYRDWMRRVIAAYNAGPGAVDRYRGVPPYPETRTYVARVLQFLRMFQADPNL